MKRRDSILIIGGMALIGAIVSMVMAAGGPGPGVESLPSFPGPEDPGPGSLQAEPFASPNTPTAPLVAGAGPDRRPSTVAMTSGIIRGDIALSPEVVPLIRSITVSVQELAPRDSSPPPYSRSRNIVMGRGTPTFEFTGIPFSQHGFVVSVFSPGLNGSDQTVAVTEVVPIATALLGISPPVPFSVLLRDQFQVPVTEMPISMQPIDLPLGRGPQNGKTDNYGSLVFEEVLAGDYLIYVDNPTNPLVKPVRVIVQRPGTVIQPIVAHVRGKQVKHQFASITVPRGQALLVSVSGPAGRGLRDAKLSMHATSTVRYQPYEGITDYSGRYVFPHMPWGEYQLNVELEGHQRWTRKVAWREGESPPQVEVRLIPRRDY